MSEKAGQFRGAAFGGFNRQDVLNYLEKLAAERKEEREAWEAEKAGLSALLEEERSARSMAENRLALLEDKAGETTDAQRALAEKEAQLAQVKAEVEELRRQIGRLAPEAQSWQRIKDTAGDIEVAAHERAQITIQDAQARAAEIRAEVVRWVLEVQGKCDALQQDLRTSIQGAEAQLDNIRAAFAETEAHTQDFQSALTNLVAETGNE
jgi:chromosome segregation ATPase